MRIFFLAFGPELTIYYQACFCILSLLKEASVPEISVATDNPKFFHYLKDRIRIIPIDQQKLETWKGGTGFFWRIKIKAIEDAILRSPGEHLVFMDTDTFLADGLEQIRKVLDDGLPLMHEDEGKLCESDGKTEKSMWSAFNGKTYHGIEINSETMMWNSGVVAIPGHKANQAVELTLNLCDEMCTADIRLGVLEQFVFALALNHIYGKIVPANLWIGHYWGNKIQWNEAIMSFFLYSLLEKNTLAQDIAEMKSFDYTALPLRLLGQAPLVRKFQRILSKHFPRQPHRNFR